MKKGQTIIVPVKKITNTYPVDKSLFVLFENKVNSISLTFDNSNNRLKKISLDLSKTYTSAHIKLLDYYLQTFYYSFSKVIGPTTNSNNALKQCDSYQLDMRKSMACPYFIGKGIKGEILWIGKNVVLKIVQKAKYRVGLNSYGYTENFVDKTKVVTFETKSFYCAYHKSERNQSF